MPSQDLESDTAFPTKPYPKQDEPNKPNINDRTGQQLGNYRLVHLIAEGGFAEVYLGEHIHLSTYAAIKVLNTQLTSEDIARFLEEARMVARLRHPHIVSILDFDVKQDTPFLVMDYAPYGTLRQRHPRGSILQPETILTYIRQVADALQYAHNQRLIHRDIKPENLLIGQNGEILLSDFGIAVVVTTTAQASKAKDIIGTVAYMAPEQLKGKPQQASDQYALGVIVYEWLCGNPPFMGSMAEVMGKHLNESPPLLSQQNPAISPALELVIMKALSKDPEQRFPRVQNFVAAIEQACQQQSLYLHQFSTPAQAMISTPQDYLEPTVFVARPEKPPTSGTKAPSSITRRTLIAGIVGATVIGLTSGGIYLFTRLSSRNQIVPPTPTQPSPSVGTVYHTYRGHSDVVSSLSWSPDGTYIASGSLDRTMQVWDTTTGGVNAYIDTNHTDAVNSVGWSPDGKYVASGSSDRTVLIWEASTQKILPTLSGQSDAVNALAWSTDGSTIASASADTSVQLCWVCLGCVVSTYSGHTGAVNTIAYSPNGQLIASGGDDNLVQVWNPTGNTVYTFQGHSAEVKAVAWSNNGKYIASASVDKTVQIWEATTGNVLLTYQGHGDTVWTLSWSPSGALIASGSADKTVQIGQPFANGNTVYTFQNHQSDVRTVSWSPSRALIASGSADKTVQIWQALSR